MYKILIVDDEMWARRSIITKLQLQGFCFSWIGEASNGNEALDIIVGEKPDIALIDVRMPFMDGIELIEKVRELGINIKLIVVSGHAEFKYAEKAINQGVSGYLLKPVVKEKITEVLGKTIEKLDYENEVENIRQKKQYLEKDNNEKLIERIINQLLYNPAEDSANTMGYLAGVAGFSENDKYVLMLVHIDNSNFQDSLRKYGDAEKLKESIKNIIEETSSDLAALVFSNHMGSSRLTVLLRHPQEQFIKPASHSFAEDLVSQIEKHLGVKISIGISNTAVRISNDLYRHAIEALDMRLACRNKRIHSYDLIESKKSCDFPLHKLELLQNCMKRYDYKCIEALLMDIFTSEEIGRMPSYYIKYLFTEVNNLLLKVCSRLNINIGNYQNEGLSMGELFDQFDCPEDVTRYLYTTISHVLDPLTRRDPMCKDLAARAKNHINQNYMQDIVVKDLAGRLAIHPSYLSTIFKKETGRTISNYITEVRIEKACGLLKDTNASISEISQKVGYNDLLYFYKVFKKITGKTTMEFRNENSIL